MADSLKELIADEARMVADQYRDYRGSPLPESVRTLLRRLADALSAQGSGEKDACGVCLGAKGGVPGNENIIHGVVMCDYCSVQVKDLIALASHPAPAAREGEWQS